MSETKGEWQLIEWIRGRTSLDPVTFPIGPGDDMAHVMLGEGGCLVTTDTLLEGTHFDLAKATPRQVGYKALAVSLSDVAAMAGRPAGAVAWVGLPEARNMAFAKELCLGLSDAADQFACPIIGGDVTSWPQPLLVIGTSVVARPAGIRPVRRSGAKPGDMLFVTGDLGGSALGRHLTFVPRIAEARRLAATIMIHAMIDLSDGLSTDLGHIARESRVAAEVTAAAIPVSADAERLAKADGRAALDHALNDGEDFELLLAVSAEDGAALVQSKPLGDLRLTPIGRIAEGSGVTIVDAQGNRQPLAPGGYEHFRPRGGAGR